MTSTKLVYLDSETTDLNPGQITQLAYIMEIDGKIVKTFSTYLQVKSVRPSAQEIHGKSVEDLEVLSKGLTFGDIAKQVYEDLSGATIVAHGVSFDLKFLSQELFRVGIDFNADNHMCTCSYFKPVLKIPNKNPKYGMYKTPSLAEVVAHLNIDEEKVNAYSKNVFNTDMDTQLHDARFDATLVFVAVQLQRELSSSNSVWRQAFCKR